ncbi:hypothetical protein [Bacillus sp. REN3]|uniref:hypothetical protein n=1 Tax=Bacillus sp. REN3 TaxID=2802440 RepID=UPI001AED93A8|nr:hypothetical protein [Bacillus sp. REN3]
MTFKDINSFKTLPEAIAYYTGVVADYSKRRDYSKQDEILELKRKLHERINKERN